MNTLTLAVFACMAVLAAAKPWDDGQWHGEGVWDHWGHHGGDVVHGNGATLIGPAVGHAVISGPVAHGYGWGHGWAGAHWGGHGHDVVVTGPHAPAAHIVGPSGSVIADGGWGHHGHHW